MALYVVAGRNRPDREPDDGLDRPARRPRWALHRGRGVLLSSLAARGARRRGGASSQQTRRGNRSQDSALRRHADRRPASPARRWRSPEAGAERQGARIAARGLWISSGRPRCVSPARRCGTRRRGTGRSEALAAGSRCDGHGRRCDVQAERRAAWRWSGLGDTGALDRLDVTSPRGRRVRRCSAGSGSRSAAGRPSSR
jgi:hypothetical protein